MTDANRLSIPSNDYKLAEAYSLISRGLKKVPILERAWVGNRAVNVPDGWQHLRGVSTSSLGDWVKCIGYPEGPWLPMPSRLTRLSIISLSCTEMGTVLAQSPNARPALSMKIGEAVVMGALPMGTELPPIPPVLSVSSKRQVLGVGMGRDNVSVKVGAFFPDENLFEPVHDAHVFANIPDALGVAQKWDIPVVQPV